MCVLLGARAPAQGVREVYYPGELEHLHTRRLLQEGIFVEDAPWERLKTLADAFGVADRLRLE